MAVITQDDIVVVVAGQSVTRGATQDHVVADIALDVVACAKAGVGRTNLGDQTGREDDFAVVPQDDVVAFVTGQRVAGTDDIDLATIGVRRSDGKGGQEGDQQGD